MPTTEKYLLGSITTLLSTGLNSLANNGLALSAAFDNTQGAAGDGYTLCDLQAEFAFGTGPTVGQVSVWFLGVPDGTNYEDGGDGTTTPARQPDVVFPVRAVTTLQRVVRRAWLPWGVMKFLEKNDGTAQTFAATLNTLKVVPVTRQGV